MPDEETRKGLLVALDLDTGELAAQIGRSVAQAFSDPEKLSGMAGALLLPLIVARGRHLRFAPLFLLALMGERAGLLAYRSYKNLEVIAQAASGQIPAVSRVEPDAGAS